MRGVWGLMASLLITLMSFAQAKEQPMPAARDQILVLSSYQFGLPVTDSINRGILKAARENGVSIDDVFVEHLDFVRNPSGDYRAEMVKLLDHKYAGKKIDLVIAQGAPARDLLAGEGKSLFPEAAILVLTTPGVTPFRGHSGKVMNIPWTLDPAGSLRVALELFPGTRRVYVITGANDSILPLLEEAQKAFLPWRDQLEFEYTNQMTYAEMLNRVASLPPHTIVIYSSYFHDASGRSFVPAEVLGKVTQTSNAPVFSTLEAYLGLGIVGGSMQRQEEIGKQAGRLALDYLAGRIKLSAPLTTFPAPTRMMFDWRELTRWKANISRLPIDSLIINKPLTLWGQYKAAVVTAVVVCLVLGCLSATLFILNLRLKRMTTAASDSEARFRVMVEHAPEAIVVFDLDSNLISDANAKAEQLLGLDRETLTKGALDRFFVSSPTASNEAVEGLADRSLRALAGEEVMFEQTIRRDDGKEHVCEATLVRLPYRGQRLLRTSLVDITERRLAQANQTHLLEQLHHSQKMDAVGQLAGGIAHDFNNMLAGIMGAAEFLKISIPPEGKPSRYLDMIVTATSRAADLTHKLLVFSRKGNKASTAVDVARVAQETVEILSHTVDKRIVITFENSATTAMVIGDDSMLQNAFMNIGINASHAMPDGGALSFNVRNIQLDKVYCSASPFELEPGPYVEVEIRDTGCGMPLEIQKRIFEPFFTTKEQGKGTGLGLAAVYGTVLDHRGGISVYSEVGQGTVFHIYLPIPDHLDTASLAEEAPLRGAGTILLVEDEEILRLTGEAILENLGYTVISAINGKDGVEIFERRRGEIDLVILDMVMPVMGGREAFDQLRKLDPSVKVLLSSGFSKEEDLDEMKRNGLCGFIRKPYRQAGISRLIAETLASDRPQN